MDVTIAKLQQRTARFLEASVPSACNNQLHPAEISTDVDHSVVALFRIAVLPLLAAQTTLAQETSSTPREPSTDGKPKIEVIEVVTPTKSAVERPVDSASLLRSARTIFVRSHSVLVKGAVVEEKLQKRPEFQQFGLMITRDVEAADLILELRHDLFTKYVYTAIDTRTQTLVASGKLSSLGGTVADKVAKRFLKQVGQARLLTVPDKKDD
jgi:hypothetical protein